MKINHTQVTDNLADAVYAAQRAVKTAEAEEVVVWEKYGGDSPRARDANRAVLAALIALRKAEEAAQ